MHQQSDQATSEFSALLPRADREAIAYAALLAHAGRHAEAECARFAGKYHNLSNTNNKGD